MEEYKLWFKKANDDLRWTKHNIETGEYSGACFSAQQTTEKALKAYLLYKEEHLRKTHDIVRLLEDCIEFDKTFKKLEKLVETLFPYYATTRYPFDNELFTFSKERAKGAFDAAKRIIEFVRSKLR